MAMDVNEVRMSLVEVVKRHDPDGNLSTIAEVLNKQNDIVADAVWREANDNYSNKTTRRSNLPSGTWRKFNEGVDNASSETVELVDVIGILEAHSNNDVDLIKSFKDPQQARMDEAMSFVEGLSQDMATAMIYGDASADPEKFTGLAPRLDDIAAAANVINEGGTGSDLCSIFVVDWGINSVYMMYPRNSKVGLEHVDMGKVLTKDSNSKEFLAYCDIFKWKAGMVVKNHKSIGRLANIESAGTTNIFDEDNLITLMNRMTKGPGRRIYVNETVMTQMEILFKDKTNVNFYKEDGLAPGPVLHFKGVPIRQVDALTITETALT